MHGDDVLMAYLRILNSSGVVTLADNRNTICLLGKGGSAPTGTIFSAEGASGTAYHFGKPQGASDYGLVLRSPSGEVLFDAVSYGRMAKPVGTMSGALPNNAQEASVTETSFFPSGRTYAVFIASRVSAIRPRIGQGQIGGVLNYWYHLDSQEMIVEIDGGMVSITAYRTLDNSQNGISTIAPYLGDGKYDWNALVLDVTGY